MEKNVQLHAPAALYPGKEPPVPICLETGHAPEPVWTRWQKKVSTPVENRNFGRPTRSLATVLTQLTRLYLLVNRL
jgi:hypothetical protein